MSLLANSSKNESWKKEILILLVLLFSCERNLKPSISFNDYYYNEAVSIHGYEPDQLKIVTLSQYDTIGNLIDSVCLNKIITDSTRTDSLEYNKRNLKEFKITHSPIKLLPKYNWKMTIGKDVYVISDIIVGGNPRCEMFFICTPIWEIHEYKVNGKLIEHLSNIVISADDL